MAENDKRLLEIPWEDDEIEFLKGDWKIWRDELFGLYRYSVGDLECREPVDAVRLIQWNMAKIREYQSMIPWERSDITVHDGFSIVRDPLDFSSPKYKRRYLCVIDDKLCSVNKYYLVRHGYVSYGQKTIDEVNKSKTKITTSAWLDDEIVLAPPKDVAIKLGSKPGLYKIIKKGVSSVRTADNLIKDGYAVPFFEAKCDKMSECREIDLNDVRAKTLNFWFNENARQIATIREIAKAIDEIEEDPLLLKNRLKEISEQCDAQSRKLTETENKVVRFNEAKSYLSLASEECKKSYKYVVPFEFCDISEKDRSIFEKKYNDFIANYNSWIDSISEVVNLKNEFIPQDRSSSKVAILQGAEISSEINSSDYIDPDKVADGILSDDAMADYKRIYAQLKTNEERIETLDRNIKSIANTSVDKENENARKIQSKATAIKKCVYYTLRHQKDLDVLYAKIGNEKNKKKRYLINKTYKYDNIKFVTAVKIKHIGQGKYEIEDLHTILTASDLLYMGLAVKK